jgi:hypothetical protein
MILPFSSHIDASCNVHFYRIAVYSCCFSVIQGVHESLIIVALGTPRVGFIGDPRDGLSIQKSQDLSAVPTRSTFRSLNVPQ